jgi:hypothetical protein
MHKSIGIYRFSLLSNRLKHKRINSEATAEHWSAVQFMLRDLKRVTGGFERLCQFILRKPKSTQPVILQFMNWA